MESPDFRDFYRRRAAEYEAIYAKPERQADLRVLEKLIPERMAGRRVLEVACGTGYWTVLVARTAKSLVATDAVEEPMKIAQSKDYRGHVGGELGPVARAASNLENACAAQLRWNRLAQDRKVGLALRLGIDRFVLGRAPPVEVTKVR